MKKVGVKALAMLVALAMIFSVLPGMAGTVQAGNEDWEEEIIWLDVEIEIIDGQPIVIYETDEGYEKIPFLLSELKYAYTDGQKILMQTYRNGILVPTEEGLIGIPIEDFCVVLVNGQIKLLVEENPLWKVPIAVAGIALKRAGIAISTATLKAASILIAAGERVTFSAVFKVIEMKPVVESLLIAIGAHIGLGTITWSLFQWVEGQCILPGCVKMTEDGSFGDVVCPTCAQRWGQAFEGIL